MIDINELRAAVEAAGLNAISRDEVLELLDRLEAAETELAELRSSMKFRTSLIGRTEAERDALRAKIAEMERQEPVAHVWRCDNGHIHGSCEREIPMGQPLYLAPYAQPEPSVPATRATDAACEGCVNRGEK